MLEGKRKETKTRFKNSIKNLDLKLLNKELKIMHIM